MYNKIPLKYLHRERSTIAAVAVAETKITNGSEILENWLLNDNLFSNVRLREFT